MSEEEYQDEREEILAELAEREKLVESAIYDRDESQAQLEQLDSDYLMKGYLG
ncbi:MAG: hypothetical protein LBT37_06375 [Lactobacillaceae bacterium]|jgi:hypothetical protein|nr:hypothetical protein [Lactobacillaceae bacterium]